MTKKFYSILLVFILVVASGCFAQKISDYSPFQLKSLAKHALMYEDPYSAIDYYEAFLKKKKDNAEVMFALAECFRKIRDYENALRWYKKAYKTDPQKQLKAQYYWAEMLMTQKKYEEAYDIFNDFKKDMRSDKSLKYLNKQMRNNMSGCKIAKSDWGNATWMTHVDTSINKNSVELSPAFLDNNTVIYSSLRTDKTIYELDVDNIETAPVRQFFVAKRDSMNWKFQSKWEGVPFNKPGINTGNGAFSPDGKRFYFTRCEKNWKNTMICKIFQSSKNPDGEWAEPIALPDVINTPKYTTTHPAVATYSKRKDEILYFVSDRSGGKGGYDIWYTRYSTKKEEWLTPKNCGTKINTAGNEVTPYVDMENRILYFSSDGWGGWGQLDVYKSIGEQSKWMPNENMKPPINSPADDLYYTLSKNLSDGFFVSNREGSVSESHATCCDDLYIFKYDEVIRIKAIGSVYARIDKSFKQLYKDKFDSGSDDNQMNIDSSFQLAEGVVASLFIIDDTAPMGQGNMVYIKNDTIDENGSYSFNLEAGKEYVIEIENYGYFNQRLNISTFLYTESDTMIVDTVGIDIMPKQPLIVKNIYYEFGKAELPRKAKKIIDSTLLTLMMENSQIIIEISSHTDNKGRNKTNKLLSQKRADGVAKYLIKKGIDKERLFAIGYGEEHPIAQNETPDGKDNPEGRERNRRTEFKIIGSLDQYNEIIYEE